MTIKIGDTLNIQITNATDRGIHIVFNEHVCFINFTAGTKINATTQGRIPLNALSTT